ncbi:hypothetical protein DXG03_003142 [Asterophora parasitica]|uniref:Uncharacterized protein n=1 Tax=Asterophora parasitica TaxID=117018 RepID=A0A9P7GEL1_9AGAR|nr:hypothetical protein DXG03_003142 [Asterophora parasitica]
MKCVRCTSSTTVTNRATNGHRFVFHSSEITATERHYVDEEPGVIPYNPITTVIPEPSRRLPYPPSVRASYFDTHSFYRTSDYAYRSRSSSPASDYLPTPPLEFADPSLASPPDAFPFPREYMPQETQTSPYRDPLHHLHHSHYHHLPHRPSSAAASPSNSASPPPLVHSVIHDSPAEHKEQPPPPRKLQSGDILFWHHLARNGEIPGVEDDFRARGEHPISAAATRIGGNIVAPLAFSR